MNEIEAVGAEAAAGRCRRRTAAVTNDRPWLYSLLIAPSAVMMNGVVQGGVLAYLLSQQGSRQRRTVAHNRDSGTADQPVLFVESDYGLSGAPADLAV